FEFPVPGIGAAPSNPAPAPPGTAAALLAQLDGRAGGTGGARTVPTETVVATSGIADVISNNVTASVQAANQAQPPGSQPPNVNRIGQPTQLKTRPTQTRPAFKRVQSGVQAAGPPSPPSPPPQGVTLAGIFKSTNAAGTALGFVGQTPPAQIPFTNATLANGTLTVS